MMPIYPNHFCRRREEIRIEQKNTSKFTGVSHISHVHNVPWDSLILISTWTWLPNTGRPYDRWKPCFPVDFPKRSSQWNFHKIKTVAYFFEEYTHLSLFILFFKQKSNSIENTDRLPHQVLHGIEDFPGFFGVSGDLRIGPRLCTSSVRAARRQLRQAILSVAQHREMSPSSGDENRLRMFYTHTHTYIYNYIYVWQKHISIKTGLWIRGMNLN